MNAGSFDALDKKQSLCRTCLSIDVRQPVYGPDVIASTTGPAIRLCFSHASSLYALLSSAIDENCHLCYLILHAIREHHVLISNRKNVTDDWDFVDDLHGFDSDNDEQSDSEHTRTSSPLLENCRQLFAATDNDFNAVSHVDSPIILEFIFRKARRDELAGRSTDIIVHWTQTGGLFRMHTSSFALVTQLPDDLVKLCDSRDICTENGTSSAYPTHLSRLWLQKCNTQHDLCHQRQKRGEVLLPTRVIDVSSKKDPFLVQPKAGNSAQYTCLSHCWGKSQPFKTENASLLLRTTAMDMKTMPQTFQDAIIITRNLGIRYLWIDSLCIIQDSAEDWAKESAQMGKIYRDASVTIFAEHADSDDGGCFASRPARPSALCRTPMFDVLAELSGTEKGAREVTFVQAKLHHVSGISLPERHSIFETIKNLDERPNPLNSRAWVLQESILSYRAILYGKDEIRWFCPSMRACECIPEGQQRRAWSKSDQGDAQIVDTRELSNAWATMVSEFSRRGLTYTKDKLPALAGIASEMSSYKKSKYRAGLWEDDLRINLAWAVHPRSASAPYHETKPIKDSGAPSWSWAKLTGEIRMVLQQEDPDIYGQGQNQNSHHCQTFQHTNTLQCKILECNATPSSKLNIFGEVKSGYLTIQGRLRLAECKAPLTTELFIDRIPVHDPITNQQIAWLDPDIYPVPIGRPIDQIWCIPLYSSGSTLTCLALTRCSESRVQTARTEYPNIRGDIFERVGVVSPKRALLKQSDHKHTNESPWDNALVVEQNRGLLEWFKACVESVITVI